MKTADDIPHGEVEDALRFARAKTRREAADFNRPMGMTELTRYAGTCSGLIAPEELQAGGAEAGAAGLRRRG